MDKFMYSLSVAGLGMVVVFAGLTLLIFCVKLMTKFATSGDNKKTKASPPVAAPIAAPPVAMPVVTEVEGIPADVIAAITAAIAAVWDGEGGFVVRRVKRVNNAPAWSRAGREEQTYSRF
ncbi:MAG: OadG family protein [Clostridiales bacterium]|nr:OadG family protein [Clostridiales bacterium]